IFGDELAHFLLEGQVFGAELHVHDDSPLGNGALILSVHAYVKVSCVLLRVARQLRQLPAPCPALHRREDMEEWVSV
ncbi:hypothetical protein, partial [Sphingopyxis sp.]|uniref:hypothetical protein n=1 Tax=Sphingopyxis sp. TaxID=1908224 RepID=UPI002EDB5309